MTYQDVFNTLSVLQNKTGNKSGTTVINLSEELKISTTETKNFLRELYDKKLITVKKGINNQLIFLK